MEIQSSGRLNLKSMLGCLGVILCLVQGAYSLPSTMDSRIINGAVVNWSNTRYQVSVRLEFIDRFFFGSGHTCGGSLIAPNAVLTATHCIWNDNKNQFRAASEFSVVMGNLDRTVKDDNTLKIFVSEIITGENFNASTFEDDVAILILSEAVPNTYSGASLIQMNEKRDLPVGTMCTVSGWGLTEKGTYSKKLVSVELPLMDKSECSINYGSETIKDGMICAGYMNGGRDACSGDSGGPLVCGDKLVGIVSFGIGCAMSGYPGVYADVAYYADRIRNKLVSKKILNADINLPIDYYNYVLYKKNDTGYSNSTQYPGGSSASVYSRNVVWMLLGFLSIFIKLL